MDRVQIAIESHEKLMRNLDRKYQAIAKLKDWECHGCVSCCYHLISCISFIEELFLKQGFEQSEPAIQKAIIENAISFKAEATQRGYSSLPARPADVSHYEWECLIQEVTNRLYGIPCPLLRNNRCLLYQYRPSCCRAFGCGIEESEPLVKLTRWEKFYVDLLRNDARYFPKINYQSKHLADTVLGWR